MLTSRRLSCSIHGHALRLKIGIPALHVAIEHLLQPFLVSEWPEGFVPIDGMVQPYESEEVMQHLPEAARRFGTADEKMEIYVDGQRFWLVDDRWGMTEIDFEANSWQSWLLPAPTVTMHEVAELAVLWPAAQLLRRRGLYLLPAISLAYDGWGMLILCPAGIEPEISALVQQGYQVLGQSWTALREEDGGVAMMHVPGLLERGIARRIRPATPNLGTQPSGKLGASLSEPSGWIDLVAESPASARNHAFCQAVILAESSRRPSGWARPVAAANSLEAMRHHWPMIELQSTGRTSGRMLTRLAELCPIFEMRLSRNPAEAVEHIEAIRSTGAPAISEQRVRQQALWDATPPLNLTPWSLAG